MNRKLFFYIVIASCTIGLKLFLSQANVDQVSFLLAPTSYLVALVNGLHFDYESGKGYYDALHRILIDKSCSGGNFFVIAFGMSTVTSIQFYNRYKHQFILLPLLLTASWCLTIIANTSRISIAMLFVKLNYTLPYFTKSTWHTIQGSFIYLSILISFYFLLQYIHPKITQYYAKLTKS